MRRWLVQLTDQLRFVLGNLDESNLSEPYLRQVTGVTAAAGEALALAREVDQTTEATFRAERQRLMATAEEIARNTETLVATTAEAITSTVASHYTARTDTAALEETLRSLIVQTASDVTYKFTTAQHYTAEVAQALADYEAKIATTIRLSEDGLTLGQSDSPFTARLDHTHLAFLQDGVEVASISNNALKITHAHITDRLTLGTLQTAVTHAGIVERWE